MLPAWEAEHKVGRMTATVSCFIVSTMANNVYVVADDTAGRAALIDPGMEDAPGILEFIHDRKLALDVVLNTHAHLDHAFNNAFFTARTGAELAIPEQDLPLLEDLRMQAEMFGLPAPDNAKPSRLLRDGDVVEVGGIALHVLHTPGHTPGTSCFLMNGVAFVGDLVFAGSIGRTDLPGGSHMVMMRSLREKLLSLPDQTILYTGHGPATTLAVERRTNPFLTDLE